MIESSESGTMITGDDIYTYRAMVIRRGLILKLDTGLTLSRRSTLSAAQQSGLTSKRTYRGALRDVNGWLQARGLEVKWSKAYPNG